MLSCHKQANILYQTLKCHYFNLLIEPITDWQSDDIFEKMPKANKVTAPSVIHLSKPQHANMWRNLRRFDVMS